MARASIIFVPLIRLLMPMDSSVPWAQLSRRGRFLSLPSSELE